MNSRWLLILVLFFFRPVFATVKIDPRLHPLFDAETDFLLGVRTPSSPCRKWLAAVGTGGLVVAWLLAPAVGEEPYTRRLTAQEPRVLGTYLPTPAPGAVRLTEEEWEVAGAYFRSLYEHDYDYESLGSLLRTLQNRVPGGIAPMLARVQLSASLIEADPERLSRSVRQSPQAWNFFLAEVLRWEIGLTEIPWSDSEAVRSPSDLKTRIRAIAKDWR